MTVVATRSDGSRKAVASSYMEQAGPWKGRIAPDMERPLSTLSFRFCLVLLYVLSGEALGQAASTMDQSDIRGLVRVAPDQSHPEHVPSRARLSLCVSPAVELPVTWGNSPITLIVPAPKASPFIPLMLIWVQSGFGGGVIKDLFDLLIQPSLPAFAEPGTLVAWPR